MIDSSRLKQSRTGWHGSGVVIATTLLLLIGLVMAEFASSYVGDLKRGPDGPWSAHVSRMDAALVENDISAAEAAWHHAYVAALRSQRWDGLVDVGHALLRIGDVAGDSRAYRARARGVYWTAVFRARQHGTVDGLLRAAEAFAGLGDRDVAAQCVHLAGYLSARSRDAEPHRQTQTDVLGYFDSHDGNQGSPMWRRDQ